jgi:hypothetical protein
METPGLFYSVAKCCVADRFLAEGSVGVRVILVYEQHILVTLCDSIIGLVASKPSVDSTRESLACKNEKGLGPVGPVVHDPVAWWGAAGYMYTLL